MALHFRGSCYLSRIICAVCLVLFSVINGIPHPDMLMCHMGLGRIEHPRHCAGRPNVCDPGDGRIGAFHPIVRYILLPSCKSYRYSAAVIKRYPVSNVWYGVVYRNVELPGMG